jgi:hypothetical protein
LSIIRGAGRWLARTCVARLVRVDESLKDLNRESLARTPRFIAQPTGVLKSEFDFREREKIEPRDHDGSFKDGVFCPIKASEIEASPGGNDIRFHGRSICSLIDKAAFELVPRAGGRNDPARNLSGSFE